MQNPRSSKLEEDVKHTIEQEIRRERKFSLASAIAQESSDFLKGESPVPRLQQVKSELINFVNHHIDDPSGTLQATLHELIQSDDAICSRHFETPLRALPELLHPLTTREVALQDFVRRVDMRWGQIHDERPRFKRPGVPPHPDDEYTYGSIRAQLVRLLSAVQQAAQQ